MFIPEQSRDLCFSHYNYRGEEEQQNLAMLKGEKN